MTQGFRPVSSPIGFNLSPPSQETENLYHDHKEPTTPQKTRMIIPGRQKKSHPPLFIQVPPMPRPPYFRPIHSAPPTESLLPPSLTISSYKSPSEEPSKTPSPSSTTSSPFFFSSSSHPSPNTTPSSSPLPSEDEDLRNTIIQLSKTKMARGLSRTESSRIIQKYREMPVSEPTVLDLEVSQLARTLLLGSGKRGYVVLSSQKRGDVLVGSGTFKRYFFCIGLHDQKLYAVGICNIKALVKLGMEQANIRTFIDREISHNQRLSGAEHLVTALFMAFLRNDQKEKCYFVFPYMPYDLCAKLGMVVNFPPQEKVRLFIEFLQGVQEVHDRRMLHRDLKPENLLLEEDSQQRLHVKVGDFGLACSTDTKEDIDARKEASGSAEYMPPEIVDAFVDAQNGQQEALPQRILAATQPSLDVWAIGIVAQCVFFTPPYWLTLPKMQMDKREHLKKVLESIGSLRDEFFEKSLQTECAYKPEIYKKIAEITYSMQRRDPQRRASVQELLKAFQALLQER